VRNSKNLLINVPFVDNSYKWAGGGILSTVCDLIKYGNHLLNSYQNEARGENLPFLKTSTIKSYLWAPQSYPPEKFLETNAEPISDAEDKESYGLGWHLCHTATKRLKYVYHTGGGVGASSCILIVPMDNKNAADKKAAVRYFFVYKSIWKFLQLV